MKNYIFPLVVVSLALNAVFAWSFVRSDPAADGAASEAVATTGTQSTTNEKPAPIDPGTWTSLQGEDLPTLVAQLRATGFPPNVVRAIVAAQISEQFTARRKALDPEADNRPFWKSQIPDPQVQAARRQLAREQQKALRDVLGDDAEPNDPLSLVSQRRRLGEVPAEKLPELKQLLRDFDERRSDVVMAGTMLGSDREKLAALEKEQYAAISKLLTPAELEEYDLRASNTANSLRSQLAIFNPTEQEFRAIFKLQRPFDEQYQRVFDTPMTPEIARQRSEGQKQLQQDIKTLLGPERAQDYERSIDYNYQQASRLVARLELPPETTNQLYAVQKETQARQMEIYGDRTLPAQERTAKLTALHEEATAKVTPLLGGNRGLEAYKQYGGSWLQTLVPRPAQGAEGGGGVISVGGGGGGTIIVR